GADGGLRPAGAGRVADPLCRAKWRAIQAPIRPLQLSAVSDGGGGRIPLWAVWPKWPGCQIIGNLALLTDAAARRAPARLSKTRGRKPQLTWRASARRQGRARNKFLMHRPSAPPPPALRASPPDGGRGRGGASGG